MNSNNTISNANGRAAIGSNLFNKISNVGKSLNPLAESFVPPKASYANVTKRTANRPIGGASRKNRKSTRKADRKNTRKNRR